jgi:hypothetical protein
MKKPPIQKPIQDDYVKSALRLPRDLHAELAAAAEYNGRGLNAEIVDRLRMAPLIHLLQALAKENAEMKAMIKEMHDLATGE